MGWIFQLIRRSLNGKGKLYHNLPFNHPLPHPSIAYHNHCLHLAAGEWQWHKRKMQFMITKQYQPRAAASAHRQKPYLQLKCNAFEKEERSTGKIIQIGCIFWFSQDLHFEIQIYSTLLNCRPSSQVLRHRAESFLYTTVQSTFCDAPNDWVLVCWWWWWSVVRQQPLGGHNEFQNPHWNVRGD